MMTKSRIYAVAALAAAVLASSASAQVRQLPTGRALDANPQAGSGGSNNPVPGYVPINPNDIITGNVAGLAYFHGRTSISSPYQFRAPLGSAANSNFYRLTAGGIPTSPGGGGVNQVYYLPSATVSTAQGSLYAAPMGSGFDSRLIPQSSVQPMVNPQFVANEPVTAGLPIRAYDRTPTIPLTPGAPGMELSSPLFGLRLHGLETPAPDSANQIDTSKERPKDDQNNNRTNPLEKGPESKTPDLQSINDPIKTAVQPDALGGPDQRNIIATNIGERQRLNTTYLTLQSALEKAQADALAASPESATTATPTATADPTRPPRTTTKPPALTTKITVDGVTYQSSDPGKPNYLPHSLLLQKASEIQNQPTSTLQAGRKVPPVKSFAQSEPVGKITPFDTLMKDAEELLKKEKYLDAADAYQRALVVQPDNPLALIGRANAEIGAGMYNSAGDDLRFVFSKKPELISVRYPVDSYIPASRVHMLLQDLTEMAESRNTGNNASFLYCYLTYNTGRTAELQRELDRWASRKWRDRWYTAAAKAWSPSAAEEKK